MTSFVHTSLAQSRNILLFGVHAGIIFFFNFWAPTLGPQLGPSLGPGLGPGLGPAAAGAGRILRSQPDPSPNAPRDQIRRTEVLLRLC